MIEGVLVHRKHMQSKGGVCRKPAVAASEPDHHHRGGRRATHSPLWPKATVRGRNKSPSQTPVSSRIRDCCDRFAPGRPNLYERGSGDACRPETRRV